MVEQRKKSTPDKKMSVNFSTGNMISIQFNDSTIVTQMSTTYSQHGRESHQTSAALHRDSYQSSAAMQREPSDDTIIDM